MSVIFENYIRLFALGMSVAWRLSCLTTALVKEMVP